MTIKYTNLYNARPIWPTDVGRLHKTEVMP